MKTQKIILGLIFLITLGLFSSCTKFERPAELSIDAQALEFDNSILNRKFNVMNIGDELLIVDAHTDRNWITVTGSGASLLHAQTSLMSVQIHPEFFREYGVYTGNLFIQSNGGNYTVPITVYYLQSSEPQLALDLDYLKFPTNTAQDYFTIYNDGAKNLNFLLQTNTNWVQLSQNTGTIIPNGEQRIYLNVNRLGLNPGIYSAQINITSNGGNAIFNLDMNVAVYSVTFFNPVYTNIEIHASGFNPSVIEPGERHSFIFPNNPISFSYAATTSGETSDGTPLGVEILWDEIIDVSTFNSPTFNLNVSSDYFFMAVKNTGKYNLDLWSINYGNTYQIDDDFVIPNNGVEYGIAYYDAFTDTDIYARLSGTSDDVVWRQGIEFVFPWFENQYILLENNFKMTSVARSNLKSRTDMQLQVKTFKKATPKSKGSIDLYNKK